mgnify:CR=1 FL=1
MRLIGSILLCGMVIAQKKDPSLWFFGQKYKSKKLMMLSTTPHQVIGKFKILHFLKNLEMFRKNIEICSKFVEIIWF